MKTKINLDELLNEHKLEGARRAAIHRILSEELESHAKSPR